MRASKNAEVDDQKRHGDLGGQPIAQPEREDRRKRKDRDRLAEDHHRPDQAARQRRGRKADG
jgi:hypothetical protein